MSSQVREPIHGYATQPALVPPPSKSFEAEALRITPRSRTAQILLTYSPAILALLLMLPRLASAEFGLFDDGETVLVAEAIDGGGWAILSEEASAGRFRPVHWLQYSLVYSLSGPQPAAFFLWNALVLVVITVELIGLVQLCGGSTLQAWLSGFFLVLSGPIVENAYTLSKPELLQSALLLGGLISFAGLRKGQGSFRRWGTSGLVSAILFLGGILTKETALLMLPIAIAWLLAAYLRFRRGGDPEGLRRTFALALAALAAAVAFFLLRGQFLEVSLAGGTYSNNLELSLPRVRDSAIRWSGWLIRDFAYLAPLGLLALIDLTRGRLEQGRLILASLLWTAAWIAIYLPWEFTVEYYMLPVALGVSVIAGAIVGSVLHRLRGSEVAGRPRWEWAAILPALFLWLTTLPNNLSNARQQLAVDEANAEMMDYLAAGLPPAGTLIVNIQQPNEYVEEIESQLRGLHGLGEVSVEVFDPQRGLPSDTSVEILIATPAVSNQPLLAVRMGVVQGTQREWNETLQGAITGRAEPAFEVERSFRLWTVDLPRLLCPLLRDRGYCREARPLIDDRVFSYGWDVYRLDAAAEE